MEVMIFSFTRVYNIFAVKVCGEPIACAIFFNPTFSFKIDFSARNKVAISPYSQDFENTIFYKGQKSLL